MSVRRRMLLVSAAVALGGAFVAMFPGVAAADSQLWPNAPTNITATAISGTSIRVTWHDNSTIESGYQINNGVTTRSLNANTTSYTWGGLAQGTYMCFRVWAYNSWGNSTSTPWACTTTPTTPSAPVNITAVATSTSTIRVMWADTSSNENGFHLTNGVSTVNIAPNNSVYYWGGLAPGTYMCFRIAAYNLAGTSAYTPWACATTPNPPSAPTNIAARPTSMHSILVTWTDTSNNESGFKLWNGIVWVTLPANTTSYTWTNLAPATYMCTLAQAFNSTGSSAYTPYACTSSYTREQAAVAWAQSVLGQAYTNGDLGDSNHVWDGWCDNFVGHAYGMAASGYLTALDHYNYLNGQGLIHTTGTPPAGALAFFDSAPVNGGDGHVMISEGNGYYITSASVVSRVTITWPGATYLGWAYADSNWPGRPN
jgi:fibronectin type III domain protein